MIIEEKKWGQVKICGVKLKSWRQVNFNFRSSRKKVAFSGLFLTLVGWFKVGR